MGIFLPSYSFKPMEDISKIIPELKIKLEKQLIPARILLDKFRIIDETSRRVSAYTDPNYAPFYYYIGTLLDPKNVADFGFRLGLLSGCFLKGCKTVKNFLGFQQKTDEYYSPRLGRANIKSVFKGNFDFYLGSILDNEFIDKWNKINWDVVIVNEEKDYDFYRTCFDVIWNKLENNGLIISDYVVSHEPCKKAFYDFCKSKNREPILIKTRYGTGLVQK